MIQVLYVMYLIILELLHSAVPLKLTVLMYNKTMYSKRFRPFLVFVLFLYFLDNNLKHFNNDDTYIICHV